MTRDEMQELKRLAESATPGPWSAEEAIQPQWIVCAKHVGVLNTICGDDEPNARFIAAANPAAVLSLIARIEELEGR